MSNHSPDSPPPNDLPAAGACCASCGSTFKGIPPDGKCPYCASPVHDPTASRQDVRAQPIAFDAWCTACGYNLLGLSTDGRCPECGKSIADSLKGDLFIHSSPTHVSTLRVGASLIFYGTLLSIPVWILQVLFTIGCLRSTLSNQPNFSSFSWGAVLIAIELAKLTTALITLIGWWQLCTLDPAYTAKRNASHSRRWIRMLLVMAIACKLVLFLGGMIGVAARDIGVIVGFIAGAVWFTRFFFEMSYIRWLAPRLASDKLARSATRLTWLAPVLLIIAVLIAFGTFVFGGLAILLAAAILLTILIMYWAVLIRVRKCLIDVESAQRASHTADQSPIAL